MYIGPQAGRSCRLAAVSGPFLRETGACPCEAAAEVTFQFWSRPAGPARYFLVGPTGSWEVQALVANATRA